MRDDLEGSWPEIEREVKSTRTRTAGELQPGEHGEEKDPEKSEGKVNEPDDYDGEGSGGGRQ